MSSLLSKFLTRFEPSVDPPSSRRVHSDADPPSRLSAFRALKRTYETLPLSSLQSLSEHLKSSLQTGDHSKKPVNDSSAVTALRSVRPKLTRLFTSSLKSSLSTRDADTARERLSPPSPAVTPAVTSAEVGTTIPESERSQEEPKSTDNHPEPFCGPLQKGRSEEIKTWIKQSLDEYSKLQEREYRHWVHTQRVAEWRRYRSRSRITKSRIDGSDRHEILVVKLIGQSETEAIFLQFARYTRDRCIDNGSNDRPLAWQRWYPDDRVTMLDEWPDERRYMRCEAHVFLQKEHKVSFMDLMIAAHLVVDAPWTDFWTRHDHWFAVLLGRTLNGKMEKTRRLKQPVAIAVVEKYGKNQRRDWFRVSTLHERRKIVELIHLCSVASHQEKARLFHNGRSKVRVKGLQPGRRIPEGGPAVEKAKDNIGEKTEIGEKTVSK